MARILFCTGTETVISEVSKERNMEIPARSHSTYKLTLELFRGNTFNCLLRRVYIHNIFESTSKSVTRAVLTAQKWQSVLLSSWSRTPEKLEIYQKEHTLVLLSSHHHRIHTLCPINAHKQRISSTSLSNAIVSCVKPYYFNILLFLNVQLFDNV